MTFRRLAKFFAVVLVLLIASPITAPFASYDIAADVSPIQESFVAGAKVSPAALLLTPFLVPSETAIHDPLFDDFLISIDAVSSPLLTALRL